MIRLSSIIQRFQAEFLAQYQDSMLPSHHKALAAMKACRTADSPKMLAACCDCDHQRLIPHSCGHRNCPHCQHHDSQQWLERQLDKQVPAPYFLLTFTLPAQLRSLAWHHQRTVYDRMIRCSWETVRAFSQNDTQLQGTPGATAVLHTHSRRLDYHPHVHLVVPGGAIDAEKKVWRTKRRAAKRKGRSKHPGRNPGQAGYLFNHKALAKVFRAKMLEALRREALPLPANCPEQWVVDCKGVGSGEKALTYLGRYLYRGVIQEKDILSCEQGHVTFRYRDSKTRRRELRTLPGAQFLWLILRHVLPKGLRRARNFGFLHPNSKRLIGVLQYLFGLAAKHAPGWKKEKPKRVCRRCGGIMKIIRTRIQSPFPRPVPVPIQ